MGFYCIGLCVSDRFISIFFLLLLLSSCFSFFLPVWFVMSEGLLQVICIEPHGDARMATASSLDVSPLPPTCTERLLLRRKLRAFALYLVCVTLGWFHCLQTKSRFGICFSFFLVFFRGLMRASLWIFVFNGWWACILYITFLWVFVSQRWFCPWLEFAHLFFFTCHFHFCF